MKIVLAAVNAKYIHSNLAVYSLKHFCQAYEDQIAIAEYTINQSKESILKDLYKRKADVICFSCYIWNISYVKSLIKAVHKVLPEAAIWLGGPEVSFDPKQELRELPQVTGIMIGEGEQTFSELVKYYIEQNRPIENREAEDKAADKVVENKVVENEAVENEAVENEAVENETVQDKTVETKVKYIREIAGIAYRENQEIVRTSPRAIMDLSEVPFPYEHMENFTHKIIYYESSRGCPFSCSYCLSSVDKTLRFRSIELVKKELQFFLDEKVPQVKFVDRTFNCRHSHAMDIWNYIVEHDNGITNFHFEVAADLLNEEEIALIQTMRPGLIQLEIGVQSTNPKTIREIRRTMDLKKVSEVVKKVQKNHNIHQHLDLIAGLPYEDYESFHQSFNQVYGLLPDQLQLGFLKVLKGSWMHECASEYGCVYQEEPPYEVLFTKWLPYEKVLRLKQVEEMVEVYYNSGQFTNTLPYLVDKFADPFTFYQKLGAFYEQKGYETLSHSRLKRYDILLEFLAISLSEEEVNRTKALMIKDLYLRENLKSRPAWAMDLKLYKEDLRGIYEKLGKKPGAKLHVEPLNGTFWLFDYERRDPLSNNAWCERISI